MITWKLCGRVAIAMIPIQMWRQVLTVVVLFTAFASTAHGDLLVSASRVPVGSTVLRYNSATGSFLYTLNRGTGAPVPQGIVFGPNGTLYVSQGNVVQAYDPSTGDPRGIPIGGPELIGPRGLAFGPADGLLYVSSSGTHEVLVYDVITRMFRVFASVTDPQGLAFGPNDNLYISDNINNQVVSYNTRGEQTGVFSGISQPRGLTFGPDGKLYVSSDAGQVFLYSGTTFEVFTQGNTLPSRPVGVVFGPDDGELYVSSSGTNEVLRYFSDGQFDRSFASAANGATYLAFTPANSAYVFSPIDVLPKGINNGEQIVGTMAGSDFFLLDIPAGTRQGFNVPGGIILASPPYNAFSARGGLGINNLGQIVGNGQQGVFLFNPEDTNPQWFTVPPSTIITGINDSQVITGYSTSIPPCPSQVRPCGVVGDLNRSLIGFNAQFETFALGINGTGQVVGATHNSENAFLRNPDGTIVRFLGGGPTREAAAYGINSDGQIVGGLYLESNFPPAIHGVIRDTDGSITFMDYPGARNTILMGINILGDLIGEYSGPDGSGGFIAFPQF